MFGFGKRKSGESAQPDPDQPAAQQQKGVFARLKAGLSKTRSGLTGGVASLLLGRKQIDDELLEDLEARLLTADVGVEATHAIIADLTRRVARKQLSDADALMSALHDDMRAMLEPVSQPLEIPDSDRPFVLLEEMEDGWREEMEEVWREEMEEVWRVEMEEGWREEMEKGWRVEIEEMWRVEMEDGWREEMEEGWRVDMEEGWRVEMEEGWREEMEKGWRVEIEEMWRVEMEDGWREVMEEGWRVEMEVGRKGRRRQE